MRKRSGFPFIAAAVLCSRTERNAQRLLSAIVLPYASAMHSISHSAPFGISFTATQLRAGFEVKYCA